MSEFRKTIGYIVIMQLLIVAVVVDQWSNPEDKE